MKKRLQIYRCDVCGNIVEVVYASKGTLVCCGQVMDLLEEKVEDAAKEKHVPVIERNGNSVTVTVGSIEHPMEKDHYIEWIQLIVGDRSYRAFLKPGDPPVARFDVDASKVLSAREYCNIHGLWKV